MNQKRNINQKDTKKINRKPKINQKDTKNESKIKNKKPIQKNQNNNSHSTM